MSNSITSKIKYKLQNLVAMLGVRLIKASGIANGYWKPWRDTFFNDAQKNGLHILPVHYYSPVPDTRNIKLNDTPEFQGKVDYQPDRAMDMLNKFRASFATKFDELATRRAPLQQAFTFAGSPYHPAEAEVLYAMVRSNRPKRIIEIGCGFSTLIIAEALADTQKDTPNEPECHYACVEPYRPDYLIDPPPQVSEFIDAPVQELSPERVAELEAGDILFIDSTHVVGIQSDVVHEFLRLLPALKPGVLIHVHDIFLPYEYPAVWLNESRFFWNEQYLLYAYILSNPSIEVLLPMHHLYRQDPEKLRELFPSLADSQMAPSAFWLRTR